MWTRFGGYQLLPTIAIFNTAFSSLGSFTVLVTFISGDSVVGSSNNIAKSYEERFTSFFETVKEPLNLHIDTTNFSNEAYRITILPSFSNPIILKYEKVDNSFIITRKKIVLNNNEDFKDHAEIKIDSILTDHRNWLDFAIAIKDSYFYFLQENSIDLGATDGEAWLIEGLYQEKYHKVYLRNPGKGSSIDKLKLLLIEKLDNAE